MRTGTFSNAEVAKAVNDLCMSTWKNRVEGFLNLEKSAEKKIRRRSFEAFATRNFCTFFVTPDRRVLHYVSGYYSPHYFLKQVEFARKLADGILDSEREPKETAVRGFRDAHVAGRRAVAEEVAELRKGREMGRPFRSEDRKSNMNSEARRNSLLEALTHVMEVHRNLSDRTVEANALVPLDEVFQKHLFGNGFTEEYTHHPPLPRFLSPNRRRTHNVTG